jgi:AraC-like DNA-binding protein
MTTTEYIPDASISAYVKNIFILENNEPDTLNVLPFFADGYPGIVFSIAPKGVFLHPQNKLLSTFFLYGQTIHPIELSISSVYRLIVFQLFPFAAKSLLNVNPKELNDECFDLSPISHQNIDNFVEKVKNIECNEIPNPFGTEGVAVQVDLITTLLKMLIDQTSTSIDVRIQEAIQIILNKKGKINIKDLREQLHITERTFERQFLAQVGVTPKQFAKFIQFQVSLNQISDENYTRLTDVVFDNGFADQSHFIRNFKRFTGKIPSDFKK